MQKLKMKTGFKIFSALVAAELAFGSSSFAGPLEDLSVLAFQAAGNEQCLKFDPESAIEKLVDPARPESQATMRKMAKFDDSNPPQVEDAEDVFFEALTRVALPELDCSTEFVDSLSAASSPSLALVREQFQNLRVVVEQYSAWLKDARSVRCPTSQEALDGAWQLTMAPRVQAQSGSRELRSFCQKGLNLDRAWRLSRAHIALFNLPPVRDFANRWLPRGRASLSEESSPQVNERDILAAYQEARAMMSRQAEHFRKKLREPLSRVLSDNDRRVLMTNESLVDQLIANSVTDVDLRGLRCDVESKYGVGRRALDTDLIGASVALGFLSTGLGLLPKALTSAGAMARGLFALDVFVLGTNSLVFASQVERNCTGSPLTLTAVHSARSCSLAPSTADVQQTNCFLASAITSVGVLTPLSSYLK
jgi:hypothetical protein